MLRALTGTPALEKILFLHNKALFRMSFKYTTVMQLISSGLLWKSSGTDNNELPAMGKRDLGLTPGLGRSLGEENGYPLHYSCLENSKDRGAWQATVHGVAKSRTPLSNFHFHFSLEIVLRQRIHCFVVV